ncbi:MAG: NeuD/PglB/VioB family sugar acetyltransferase [Flavobacteriaceae bacterium]|nr:NeuD/PglB/VioB family sugar acetyltransferase [Flavobacteriaceae bacterium]
MIIVGAKGFAKELLEILHQNGDTQNLCFYDDVSNDISDVLYGKFRVLRNIEDVEQYFLKVAPNFTIGIGKPKLRYFLYEKFKNIRGGVFTRIISKYAEIGSFGVEIGEGCNILGGVKISNDVKIGKGTMIYYNSIITHDVEIGDFVEISPGATLLGRCKIGNMTQIGAGAIIFPDVVVGNNCIIAAGAVVRESVPDNVMLAGVPAVIKKEIK